MGIADGRANSFDDRLHRLSEQSGILSAYGYSLVESQFLYLAVSHSGFFTRRQFLRFTGKTKGWAVHRFTQKLLTRGHATVTPLLHKTFLFHLCSRQMYDDLERTDLRIRSTCSDDFILARLLTLDFVIAHPGLNYLETAAEKLAFFTEKMGFPMQILPGKVYAGISSLERKKRYFTDRCPIYLESENLSPGPQQRPVFVYCDPYAKSLDAFKTHLRRYEDLLYRLTDFRFVYASPYPKKLDRAKAMFDRFIRLQERLDLAELVRYFRVRWLWDEWKHTELTREDRDRVRAGDKRFCGEPFASAYRKWCQEPMGEAELRTFLGPSALIQNYHFETHLLPERHSIFRYETVRAVRAKSGTIAKTRWSADRSAFSSTADEWDHL